MTETVKNEITDELYVAYAPERSAWELVEGDLPQFSGAIEVLGRAGDTKHIWDKNNDAEVKAAKALFDSLKKDGYLAYSVKGKDGEKGDVVTRFDKNAERLIFAPPMQGG